MSLENTVNQDIKAAMLAKDKKKLEALRAIKAAILLAKTDKTAGTEVSEENELKLLQKLVKQRQDTAIIYTDQGRNELAEEELFQADVIRKYLPEQMSVADIRETIKTIVDNTGASGMKDMGKVMGAATKALAGKAENKIIAGIVKELLSE
ncbi:MAG: GatB/YqeY domain-containing protein [Bacteroidales bacterium]|nr:GatB/YqeY domain-containing protein [Bacteroidales bacterium]